MLKNTKIYALAILAFLFSFTGVAIAADAATPSDGSLLDLLKPLYDAFSGGHYAVGACATVVLVVAVLRRYSDFFGAKFAAFMHSDRGGTLAALFMAMFMSMGAALAAPGAHLSWGLMWTTFLVGVGAAGGYAVLKNVLVEPMLKPLQAKLPAWAQPILSLVLWVFEHGPGAGAQEIAKAQQAGDAAVAAKPAPGVAGVVKITEEK